jgi:hypothetical protein
MGKRIIKITESQYNKVRDPKKPRRIVVTEEQMDKIFIKINLDGEETDIPIETGDELMTGKFRNKKTNVKDIGLDDNGLPTINGKKILNFRIPKLMKPKA